MCMCVYMCVFVCVCAQMHGGPRPVSGVCLDCPKPVVLNLPGATAGSSCCLVVTPNHEIILAATSKL